MVSPTPPFIRGLTASPDFGIPGPSHRAMTPSGDSYLDRSGHLFRSSTPTADWPQVGDSLLDQRAELVSLRKEMEDLREEVAALTECLLRKSILRPDTHAAARHRYAFEAVRRKHPFATEANLDTVLTIEGVAGPVGDYADCPGTAVSSCALCVRACSRSVRTAASLAWPETSRQLGVRIRLCGGSIDGVQPLDIAEVLDVAAGVWKAQPSMPAGRSGAAAGVILRKLYICGGTHGGVTTTSVDCFDPEGGAWEAAAPMLEARQGAAAAGVADELQESLCICGGWNEALQHLRTTECLRATVVDGTLAGPLTWTPLPPMAERRTRPAAGTLGRELHVCGGWCDWQRWSSVERFDLGTQTWRPGPPMLVPRDAPVAGVAAGVLYVCGGWSEGSAVNTAERLEPSSGAWEAVAPMHEARCGATSVAVAGRLYVFGGFDGGRYLSSCEVLNPLWGLWLELPPLGAPRWGAAAAAVREGKGGR